MPRSHADDGESEVVEPSPMNSIDDIGSRCRLFSVSFAGVMVSSVVANRVVGGRVLRCRRRSWWIMRCPCHDSWR